MTMTVTATSGLQVSSVPRTGPRSGARESPPPCSAPLEVAGLGPAAVPGDGGPGFLPASRSWTAGPLGPPWASPDSGSTACLLRGLDATWPLPLPCPFTGARTVPRMNKPALPSGKLLSILQSSNSKAPHQAAGAPKQSALPYPVPPICPPYPAAGPVHVSLWPQGLVCSKCSIHVGTRAGGLTPRPARGESLRGSLGPTW